MAGGYYRDALEYIHVSLGLGFLPRTVPEVTTHPSFQSYAVLICQNPQDQA